jgi:hypothetical protein
MGLCGSGCDEPAGRADSGGLRGAAVAALLGAVSPWHLGYSRFAQEVTTAPATIDAAMVCFFLWLRRKRNSWLMLSALLFGLSLYSYSITKVFVPAMIVLLGVLRGRGQIPLGLAQAIGEIDRFNDGREPVTMPEIDKSYMYVLFLNGILRTDFSMIG